MGAFIMFVVTAPIVGFFFLPGFLFAIAKLGFQMGMQAAADMIADITREAVR